MPLNPKLQKFSTASPVITSFDFVDIADGTGVVTFFPFISKTSAGEDEHLGTEAVFGRVVTKFVVAISGAMAQRTDDDFDLTAFNASRTIEGTALISIPVRVSGNTVGSATVRMVCVVKHFDGSTETNLVTVTSDDNANVSGPGVVDDFTVLMPAVIPRTHFAKGDTLRLTIELWGTGGGNGNDSVQFFVDPANRAVSGADTTAIKFFVPFDLQL